MGRIRSNIRVNDRDYWTLFDSAATHSYIIRIATSEYQSLPRKPIMNPVIATVRNGRIEVSTPVMWPDGTRVQVTAIDAATSEETWTREFLDEVREGFADEPLERPGQLPLETRESW